MPFSNEHVPDYYQELALTPAASDDDLRRTFRNLARILHPDRQSDDETRRAAEGQLKRLHQIRSILLDREKRSSYDQALAARQHLASPAPLLLSATAIPTRQSQVPAWGLATVITIMSLSMWLWPHQIKQTMPAEPATPEVISLSEKPFRVARVSRAHSPRALVPAIPSAAAITFEPVPRIANGFTLARDPELPPFSRELPQPPPDSLLTGVWVSTRQASHLRSTAMYSAEYIQVRIQDSGPEVKGSYEARYRVPDVSGATAVMFHFAGERSAITRLPWLAQDGSRGYVSLQLLGPDRLQVSWTADSLGSELGLISGKANLARFQDR